IENTLLILLDFTRILLIDEVKKLGNLMPNQNNTEIDD
ncbi:MAG: hypothetical protein RL637_1873, partial [Pseudomonadota bacterium]